MTMQCMRETARLFPWVLSFTLFVTGCVRSTGYQPNATLLQHLTRTEATKRIRYILLRSINPSIDEVTVTEEFLNYRLHPTSVVVRLFFGKIAGVEVFDNHAAFVRAYGGPLIAQLFFATAEDAMMFADLLMSLCAAYLAQNSSEDRHTAPQTP